MPIVIVPNSLNTVTITDGDQMIVPPLVLVSSPGDAIASAASGPGNVVLWNLGQIRGGLDGVDIDYDDATIHNYGQLSGNGGAGIHYSGAGTLRINNHSALYGSDATIDAVAATGDIELLNTGQFETGGTHLIDLRTLNASTSVRVDNHGLMSGGVLELGRGDTSNLRNSGTIRNDDGVAVTLYGGRPAHQIINDGDIIAGAGFFAIETVIGANLIQNSGTITGGITTFGSARMIDNSGVINGDIIQQEYSGQLDNSGQINGLVRMGARHDRVMNSGEVTGNVDLYNGNDYYEATGDGVVLGLVRGGIAFGRDTIIGASADDNFMGDGGDDLLRGNGGDDTLAGGHGNDQIEGGSGNDLITGGTENDRIDAGSGHDDVSGGEGNDTIDGGDGYDELRGDGGNDTVSGGVGGDTVDGGSGDDMLFGNAGHDYLIGGGGADTMDGGADNDYLVGGAGNDTLTGGAGEDGLVGGDGDDRLAGGANDDYLSGGAGADVFVFGLNEASDVVTDFENGTDRIDLTAYNIAPADYGTTVANAVSDLGGIATLLDLSVIGGSGYIVLEGLAITDVDVTDFIL